MLPPRQLRRQAASPGVRFRSPGAAIACLAGKPRRGRHPNTPYIHVASHTALTPSLFIMFCCILVCYSHIVVKKQIDILDRYISWLLAHSVVTLLNEQCIFVFMFALCVLSVIEHSYDLWTRMTWYLRTKISKKVLHAILCFWRGDLEEYVNGNSTLIPVIDESICYVLLLSLLTGWLVYVKFQVQFLEL